METMAETVCMTREPFNCPNCGDPLLGAPDGSGVLGEVFTIEITDTDVHIRCASCSPRLKRELGS